MLTAAYHMLSDGTFYQDLGPDHFDRRSKHSPDPSASSHASQNLGYAVDIKPIAAAP